MFESSRADRARTVLRAATSVSVLTMPDRVDEVSVHGVDGSGAPLLVVSHGSPLFAEVRAGGDDLAAVVHALDVSPTPSPDRVRGEVWLGGWLAVVPPEQRSDAVLAIADRRPEGALLDVGSRRTVLRLDVAEIRLRDALAPSAPTVDVDPEQYAAAQADPLIDIEAEWLSHLVNGHPAEFAALCRLIHADLRPAGSTVRPIAMDRYGFLLRVDGAAGRRTVRVPFPTPVRCAGQLPRAMAELLDAARRRVCCRHSAAG